MYLCRRFACGNSASGSKVMVSSPIASCQKLGFHRSRPHRRDDRWRRQVATQNLVARGRGLGGYPWHRRRRRRRRRRRDAAAARGRRRSRAFLYISRRCIELMFAIPNGVVAFLGQTAMNALGPQRTSMQKAWRSKTAKWKPTANGKRSPGTRKLATGIRNVHAHLNE